MTTYNTYQEAKIANPESNIYIHTGEFWCEKSIRPSSWTYESRGFKLCNPADYCMTVEEFLADGHKFVGGDLILDESSVYLVADFKTQNHWYETESANEPDCDDDRRFILRGAALEEKKPRTKVKYEKWNFECAWHAIKAFEDGERIYTKRSHKDYILIDNAPDVLRFLYDLHERIETPITWQEELYDYLDSSCEMSDDFDDSFTIGIEGKPLEFNLNDDEFVDMCKFVASLNSVN